MRHLGILLSIAHTVFLTTAAADLDRILILPNPVLSIGGGPVCKWSAVESKGEGIDRLVQFEVATEGFTAEKVRWRLPVYATENGRSRTDVHRVGLAKLDAEHRFRFHVSVADLGKSSDANSYQLEVSDAKGHQSRCALERRVIASLLDAVPATAEARASR